MHNYVRILDQFMYDRYSSLCLYIDRDAAFIPIESDKWHTDTIRIRSPSAGPVPGTGAFDFNHIRAKVAEQLRAYRSLPNMCEIDYANS